MSSLQAEYQRFLIYLAGQSVQDDVRRMANLIMANLQSLAEVGAQRRARSGRLAPIALQHLAGTVPHLPEAVQPAQADRAHLRLNQLEVGPFRGFMRPEVSDLSHDITLVYGPNGAGKSSFFEALETAMLGSISETEAKRFAHRSYCDNARLRRHEVPRLFGSVNAGNISQIQASEKDYRFCFVEKNRLDDFGRIAARTPGDQRQLIATLFGVDQFSEFVRGFNATLDENLSIASVRALQLEGRRNQVAASQQLIDTYKQRVAGLAQEEEALAARIHQGSTYEACVNWILGTQEAQGRLAYLQGVLESPVPALHGCTAASLQEKRGEVYESYAASQAAQQALTARAGEVSYSNLYEALLQLADNATSCPACGTHLDQVAQNPFERARVGLAQLAELRGLQQRSETATNRFNESFRSLHAEMQRACGAVAQVCPNELQAAQLPELPPTSVGNWFQPWVDADDRAWLSLLELVNHVEQADAATRQITEQRQTLAQERMRLDGFKTEIERCKFLRSQAITDFTQAQATIAQFEADNQQLIEEVGREALTLEHNRRVKAAYDGYLPQL